MLLMMHFGINNWVPKGVLQGNGIFRGPSEVEFDASLKAL